MLLSSKVGKSIVFPSYKSMKIYTECFVESLKFRVGRYTVLISLSLISDFTADALIALKPSYKKQTFLSTTGAAVPMFLRPCCRILPDTSGYCRILPDTARYCPTLPDTADTARYCLILPDTARYCLILPDTARYCPILPDTA